MKIVFALIGLGLTFAATAPSEPAVFRSGTQQVSLLELYTSEGCSSCPPADAWLNKLKAAPGLWQQFAPVAFHVDYWNYLGWSDPWSAPEFSGRQRDFAQLWHSDNIYTPEFALNGHEWRNWFGLRGVPGNTGAQPGVLAISSTNNIRWQVSFTPADTTPGGFEIHAALLAGGLRSQVTAGENSGRMLVHEFTAIDLVQIGLTTRAGVASGQFILDAPHPASEKARAVTAWITRGGEMTPVQATGGWLPLPGQP